MNPIVIISQYISINHHPSPPIFSSCQCHPDAEADAIMYNNVQFNFFRTNTFKCKHKNYILFKKRREKRKYYRNRTKIGYYGRWWVSKPWWLMLVVSWSEVNLINNFHFSLYIVLAYRKYLYMMMGDRWSETATSMTYFRHIIFNWKIIRWDWDMCVWLCVVLCCVMGMFSVGDGCCYSG